MDIKNEQIRNLHREKQDHKRTKWNFVNRKVQYLYESLLNELNSNLKNSNLKNAEESIREPENQSIEIRQSQKLFYLSLEIQGHRYRIKPDSIMEYSSATYSFCGTDT